MRLPRTLALLAAAGLTVGLAACGGDGGTETSGSATTTSQTSTSSTSSSSTSTSGTSSQSPDTTTASPSGPASTSSGAWSFTRDAEGRTTASVPEKTGKNGATLTFTHDPTLLGREAKMALDPGSRESCALGYETRMSVDGGSPTAVLGSNVDGNADVVLFDERAVWKQVSQATTVTIEAPTGPNCRASDATWTTYEFDVTGAAQLPMDKTWGRPAPSSSGR